MDSNEPFSVRLKRRFLRAKGKTSLRVVAVETGINHSTLSRWVSNNTNIMLSQVDVLLIWISKREQKQP